MELRGSKQAEKEEEGKEGEKKGKGVRREEEEEEEGDTGEQSKDACSVALPARLPSRPPPLLHVFLLPIPIRLLR